MWIWLILIYLISPNLYAANPYQLGEVDYFQGKTSQQKINQEKETFNWQEASIDENGQLSVYTPPAPMLSLLENPTDENAKAYLEWQRLKVHKIIKAQQIIDKVLMEEEE